MGAKARQTGRQTVYFHYSMRGRELLIEKKLQKKLRFLFSRGMDRCNGADSVKDAREIDDDNGTNLAEEDRHFANVAIAFFVASFCTCPFAMLS